jgi:hypothetical protein
MEVFCDGGNNSNCPSNILPEEEGGLALDGDADVIEEEPRAVTVEALSLSGE